jgi:citrate lyase subunit beta/citryl-CoA lyase
VDDDPRTQVIRSYLYVPGHDEARIAKAFDSEADAVVIDLEDAVPLAAKETARRVVADVVAEPAHKPLFVRVNAVDSGMAEADLEVVSGPGITGVRLPKTEGPGDVEQVARRLALAAAPVAIVPLIESAIGVELAWQIASCSEHVAALAMGEADLRADLGVTDDAGLCYARSRCVTAARAAGRIAVQSVYPRLRDDDGLRSSTEQGRRMGFTGRSAIHPAQVVVINDVLTPTEGEVRAAAEVVAAYEHATNAGAGTVVTADGRFLDPAVVRSAQRVLALARAARGRPGTAAPSTAEPDPTARATPRRR